MSILLVALLVLLFTFQSAFCNMFAKHYPGDGSKSSPVYSVFYGVIVSVVTLVFAGFSFEPSKWTVILGIVNGAVLFAYNTLLIKASQSGPFSVTMIFNLAGGILIPMFWAVFHDGAELSGAQYIAIAVMLISFVFLNLEDKKGGEESKVSLKFILYSLFLGIANGVYGTIMSTQKVIVGAGEDSEIIILTFATSALLAFLSLLIKSGRATFADFRQNTKSLLSAIAASVSAASAVNLMMYCLSLINVAVLYSLQNGGVLIVSILWSLVILREKIGGKKIIGLILAIAAVFALSVL